MITEFREDKINDIASAQLLAWKEAFQGILSEKLLSNLAVEEFTENWKEILLQKERRNFIWVEENGTGVGFVSFGKPRDKRDPADFEIYGLYVHPQLWRKGIGSRLMSFAVKSIRTINPSATIVLWTMERNVLSQNFYYKSGFRSNGKRRDSNRKEETFVEIQLEDKVLEFPEGR